MRRLIAAVAAVSLIAAPTASAVAQTTDDAVESPAGRDLPPRHWDTGLVLSIAALAVLFAILLIFDDDDNEDLPTSP